jgi:hypothetical protein
MISEYIKQVLSKWWLLLGFIPEILDKVSVYLDVEIKIPDDFTFYLFLVLFFFSTYLVWKDEKQKNKEFEEKLKNPVDYEITAEIHPFDDDIENSIMRFENKINETQKEIEDINISIKGMDNTKIEDTHSELLNSEVSYMIKTVEALKHKQYGVFLSSENVTMKYHEKLFHYKYSLENYIKEMKNYIDEMKDYYEKREGKIYYIIFIIHNTGSIFDEHLDINISSKRSIFSKNFKFDNIPEMPNKPEKPKENYYEKPYPPDILRNFDSSFLNNLDLNHLKLRKYEEIKDNNISLIFRDLKVDVKMSILENGVFVKSENLNDLEIEISSKNSNKKIQKKIKLEMKDKLTFLDICKMIQED